MDEKPTLTELLAEADQLQRTAEELREQSIKLRVKIQTASKSRQPLPTSKRKQVASEKAARVK
ncbi:MAG TPA: hypothetical protein VFA89_19260 [Terriglobales bacterium]|nr:hypothetical protein [Terriglobales bacterium]